MKAPASASPALKMSKRPMTILSRSSQRSPARAAILIAALGLLVAGCGDDPAAGGAADAAVAADGRPGDAVGPDSKVDAGPDAAADVASDVAPDTGSDAAADHAPQTDGDNDAGNDGGVGDAGIPGDGGAGDGAPASGKVWPASATQMVAEDRGGGFGPGPPPGSKCQGGAAYTMTVADKNLAWRLCQSPSPGLLPYEIVVGHRMLTTAEFSALTGALDKVVITTGPSCGADKPVLALKVTTPPGEREYLDDFYACLKQGVYVAGLDGVFQVLRPLVK